MKLFWLIYKNETALLALIISLFLWGLVASLLAFKNKAQVVLIGKTKDSYQIKEGEAEL